MSRIATTTDAADSNGYTALHFAVRSDFIKGSSETYLRRLQVSILLMRYGARWELEDDHGVTAAQIAWERILKNEHEAQGFREVFPESQTLPLFDFSDVHKTVLALLPVEIEAVLLKRKWRAQVDLRDAWGRTPLHWAILREDEKATRALITSGASIDIGDNEGNMPLHFAAGCPTLGCLNILLDSDAKPRIKNANGAEPLHFASWQTITHVKVLIQAGALATALDNRGSSVLEWACWCNKHVLGEYLVKMGADKNHADRLNGNPPLFSALTSQAYEFLEMLLSHDVNVLHINNTGSTVLHWTARCADIRMLRIIKSRKSQFKKVNISAKDKLGRTAKEVLEATGCTEEFSSEFVQFLNELHFCQRAEPRQIKRNTTFQKATRYFFSRTHSGLTVLAAFTAGALLYTLPFHYSAMLIVGILTWATADTLNVHYGKRRRRT
ncbi:ankyrin [Amniculicola lignicola CBS 123094]|uniref:Ankyrin n=1 Tax=Amniculicola lignicola CBS 123094 TaxID=1392246 RepID=A0A6A5W3H1_9PLEO|nr:ankyrin [Amniculicola lignicola CBS 123094]